MDGIAEVDAVNNLWRHQSDLYKTSFWCALFQNCTGSSGYETNYDRRPSFRRRGTSSMEQSSSVRHRLLVS